MKSYSFLLSVGALAMMTATTPVFAQGQAAPADASASISPLDDAESQVIVVTGSRSGARAVDESLVPISVAGSEDLARSGRANLRDSLAQVLPNYQVQAGGYQGQQGAGVRGARLRGLDAKDTLILVDGVRRHTTSLLVGGASPTDLDLIPSNAVERIEVLGNGAASLYGSDAIAGVINIILKKTVDTGGTFTIQYGQNGTSVGDLPDKFGRTKTVQYHQGWRIGDSGGFFNFSANAQRQNGTNNYPGYRAATLTDRTTLLYPTLPNGALDPRETSVSRYRQWLGQPSSETYSFAYNTELPLAPNLTFYSNGTYAWRYSSGPGYFRTASNQSIAPGTTPSPQSPFANPPYTSGELVYPDGYLPTFDIEENDFQALVGLKGDLAGWGWNLSTSLGGNHAKVYTNNSINVSAGPQYWGQRDFYDGAHLNRQLLTTLALSKELSSGPFGRPLTISAGVEHRYDSFKKREGELLSYYAGPWVWPTGTANAGIRPNLGAQGLSGITPEAAGAWSRHILSGYIEFNQELSDGWTVDLSGRYEHFSDFGDAWSGQISTRYELSPDLAIRGSFGNGFSAPTLLQQNNTTRGGSYSVDNNPLSPTFGQYTQRYSVTTSAYEELGRTIGVSELKPEYSINAAVGFVAKPFPRTTITADGYLIDIRNRIVSASANVTPGTALHSLLTARGIYNVTTVAFNINGAHTFTKGVDLRLDHSHDIGNVGALNWTLASNQNVTSVKSFAPLPTVIGAASAGTLRTLGAQFTSYYPKNISSLALRWEYDRLNFTAKGTRWSATQYRGANAGTDERQSPAVTVDASVSYDATDWARLSVGGTNIFNKRPDRISMAAQALQFISATEVAPYNRYAPFGLDGGFYYARLDIKW